MPLLFYSLSIYVSHGSWIPWAALTAKSFLMFFSSTMIARPSLTNSSTSHFPVEPVQPNHAFCKSLHTS